MPVELRKGDALILVDVQKDFLPGGALAVPRGGRVIDPLNRALAVFRSKDLPIFATRDWHPEDHCSFEAQGGPWPPHCVAGTEGAEFSAELSIEDARVIDKASHPLEDAYSGFEGTTLHDELLALDVSRVFIGGLATDYCILNTVRDALRLGYQVYLLVDAISPVNIRPDDEQKAMAEMQELGAIPVTTRTLPHAEAA